MYVYGTDIPANDTISSCSSAHTCTLTTAASGSTTGDDVSLSTAGGCGLYDLHGSSVNTASGSPSQVYWNNCVWGTFNVTVSGNDFNMASNSVTGCTAATLCGVMGGTGYNAGLPSYWVIYGAYFITNITIATSPLDNVWSHNCYAWTGSASNGAWAFETGAQGSEASQATWQGATYNQDAGSTFGTVC
jgi:hypothetical protein